MQSKDLQKVEANIDKIKTVGDLMQVLGGSSLWVLCLLLAAPIALPLPAIGIAQLLAVPLVLILVAILRGKESVWLPSWTKKIKLGGKLMRMVMEKIHKTIDDEQQNKSRTSIFSEKLSAIMCLLACACVAVPLPLTNTFPSIGVFFISLGNIFASRWWKILGGLIVIGGFFVTAGIIFFGVEAIKAIF